MLDLPLLSFCLMLAPAVLMAASALAAWIRPRAPANWQGFQALAAVAGLAAAAALALRLGSAAEPPAVAGLAPSLPAAWIALLVQWLGVVIGAFSARYLQGEAGQARYVRSLATVLAAVHLLLLADHWLVLIAAWAVVGLALEDLLCFYRDRPFALLAAHKKRLADRIADGLLLAAATLAWADVGSGSLTVLRDHLAANGASTALQASGVCLVLAVILRTALLPVHGWLIQVMEAPTPVSALLHAGVVNLGGFVLIRFAPLLEAAPLARGLLVAFGLATAMLAGLVMLTRVSIKVRLAWSTVAQMGFMVLECGLGLYTLALLHLIGHSLYKAHAFLASSSVVREKRLLSMNQPARVAAPSLLAAPLLAVGIVAAVVASFDLLAAASGGGLAWPWWWSALLAFAWAPLLWWPLATPGATGVRTWQLATGILLVALLSLLARTAHAVPLGLRDAPHEVAGLVALAGMAILYLCLAVLQWRPETLSTWRRWSYAGFYVDEAYTRLALRLWPGDWAPKAAHAPPVRALNASALTATK